MSAIVAVADDDWCDGAGGAANVHFPTGDDFRSIPCEESEIVRTRVGEMKASSGGDCSIAVRWSWIGGVIMSW